MRIKSSYCDLLLLLTLKGDSQGSRRGLTILATENLPQRFLYVNSKGLVFGFELANARPPDMLFNDTLLLKGFSGIKIAFLPSTRGLVPYEKQRIE